MLDVTPLRLILITFAGWVTRQQAHVVDYLVEENRVLKEQLKGRRLRLTDDQRRLEHRPAEVLAQPTGTGLTNPAAVRRNLQHRLPAVGSVTRGIQRECAEPVAEFDDLGLWSSQGVWFSVQGTLLSTAAAFVDTADCGYFVEELDNVLHVGTKDALRKLVEDARLTRSRLAGQFLYCATEAKRKRQQLVARRAMLAKPGVARALPDDAIMPDELRAAIVLFFSMLDEKM